MIVAGDFPQVSDGKRIETSKMNMEDYADRIPFTRHDILNVTERLRDIAIKKADGTIHEGYIHQMKQIGKDKVLFIASVKEPDSRDISTKEELCIEVKAIIFQFVMIHFQEKYMNYRGICRWKNESTKSHVWL